MIPVGKQDLPPLRRVAVTRVPGFADRHAAGSVLSGLGALRQINPLLVRYHQDSLGRVRKQSMRAVDQ
jgi:hypothetical protein